MYVRGYADTSSSQADKIVSPEKTILEVGLQEAKQLADTALIAGRCWMRLIPNTTWQNGRAK
jgi:hypothetical protein